MIMRGGTRIRPSRWLLAAAPALAMVFRGCGSSDSGDSGSPGNPCFVGDGVLVDPAPWEDACRALSPQNAVPVACLDQNDAGHIGAPTLPNGRPPSGACVRFHNADGARSSLGSTTGCDGEVGISCWCCSAADAGSLLPGGASAGGSADIAYHCNTGPDFSVPVGGPCDGQYPQCCVTGVCVDQGDTVDGPYTCE